MALALALLTAIPSCTLLLECGLNVCPQVLWRRHLMLRQLVVQLLCPLVLCHVYVLLHFLNLKSQPSNLSLILLASIFLALKNREAEVLSLMPNSWAISRCDRSSKTKRLSTVR